MKKKQYVSSFSFNLLEIMELNEHFTKEYLCTKLRDCLLSVKDEIEEDKLHLNSTDKIQIVVVIDKDIPKRMEINPNDYISQE